jgi:sensor histidine kinase YesM
LEDQIDTSATAGLGLANTRARLSQLYGSAQHLVLENIAGGGFRVRIEIPFHIPEGDEERRS